MEKAKSMEGPLDVLVSFEKKIASGKYKDLTQALRTIGRSAWDVDTKEHANVLAHKHFKVPKQLDLLPRAVAPPKKIVNRKSYEYVKGRIPTCANRLGARRVLTLGEPEAWTAEQCAEAMHAVPELFPRGNLPKLTNPLLNKEVGNILRAQSSRKAARQQIYRTQDTHQVTLEQLLLLERTLRSAYQPKKDEPVEPVPEKVPELETAPKVAVPAAEEEEPVAPAPKTAPFCPETVASLCGRIIAHPEALIILKDVWSDIAQRDRLLKTLLLARDCELTVPHLISLIT